MYVIAEDEDGVQRWRRGLVCNSGTLNSYVGNAIKEEIYLVMR